MFPLTAFGLFIILRSNISGLPMEMRISLIWLIHLKLIPCFDSVTIDCHHRYTFSIEIPIVR